MDLPEKKWAMENVTWISDDLCNLLELSLDDLTIIYPDIKRSSLKRTRTKKKRLIKEGKLMPPRRSQEFEGAEFERERAQSRRRAAPTAGRQALKGMVTIQVPEEDAIYHQELQEALDEHGALNSASFTDWQALTKGNDGEAEIHDLHRKRFDVKFEHEPAWPIVQRAESKITYIRSKEQKIRPDGFKTAVILPDPQFGYRLYDNGELDPFHDENALSIANQIIADVKPDTVICLGDLMDLPEWSKYEQTPEFAQTTQKSIDRAHEFLAKIRATVPDAHIVSLEGNHDRRLHKSLVVNASASLRLKRAADTSDWPVMSVPYLVNFEKLDVEYVEGYPANTFWINDRLQIVHGSKALSGRSTAQAIASDERVSTIFGHIHRIETQYKTVNVREGARTSFAHTPGCLCRIDGAVPSTKGSTRLDGRPVERYENWQQGLMVLSYKDGDAPFSFEQVFINTFQDYETRFNGKTYKP